MTAIGFSACIAALRVSTDPWVFIFGLLFIALQWALLYHMLLAFPDRQPAEPARARCWSPPCTSARWSCTRCRCCSRTPAALGFPENVLLVEGNPDLSITLSRSRYWLALVLIAALVVILARRWRAARGIAATGACARAGQRRRGDGAARGLVRGAARPRGPGLRGWTRGRPVRGPGHGAVRLPVRAPAQPRRRCDRGQRGGRPAR